MKSLTLATLLLMACQGNPPPKPVKPLDPQDARSVLEHAAFNTRNQKSYETRFKARLTTTGAPLDYDGRCVWVHPGVLYVHYTASGGDEKMIVRAGDRDVWVYNSLVGWVTADEAGMGGAGRGIQNPDDVLAVLARNSGTAKLAKPGLVELEFKGEDIERIMKEQASKGAFDWKESNAKLDLATDSDHRLQKFTCDATLKSTDPNVKGAIRYTAEVSLVGYDGARDLKFLDEKKRQIPLLPEMTSKIDSILKEKR
jgi:outer membrane lipoprotein-sorting protein